MNDENSDFLKRGRARARKRFLLFVVLLAFSLGGVGYRAVGVIRQMSRAAVEPEPVRVLVSPDLTASFDGRVYPKDGIDRLLDDVAAGHPGAYVLVCSPELRNATGAMLALRTLNHGLKGGLLLDSDPRCAHH